MIKPRSILTVLDNSGAKFLSGFTIITRSKHKSAQIGDIIIASVQVAEPRREIKKKDVVKALVVRQSKPYRRNDGSYISFDENSVVIVNDKFEPVGNRIFGPSPREIKEKGFTKVAALAPEIV